MALSVNAQTFIDDIRKTEKGKGKVTVQQSKEIDDLVNGNTAASKQRAQSVTVNEGQKQQSSGSTTGQKTSSASTPPVQQSMAGTHNNETTKQDQHSSLAKDEDVIISDNSDVDIAVDTRKKVMRNSYKTTGYRIQVFSGGNSRNDRQKAEQAGTAMKRMFPNEPIYVHFYSPAWKCRMGNYRTVADAQKILKQVKTVYPQACIVKGTINVQY